MPEQIKGLGEDFVDIRPQTGSNALIVWDLNASAETTASTRTHISVWCGSPATQIAAANTSRKAMLVRNEGTNDKIVFLGSSNVTDINGLPMASGDSYNESDVSAALFGYVSSGSENVKVISLS